MTFKIPRAFRQAPRPRRRPSWRGRIESLEGRILLSGDVSAVVHEGNLNLQGDGEDNLVEVTVTGDGVIVRGLDGTTINGAGDDFVAFAGVDTIDGNLVVNLRGGDDVLLLSGGLNVGRDVRFHGGAGDDRVGLENVSIGHDFNARMSHGDDGIHIEDSSIGGQVHVISGEGDETLAIRTTSIGGDLKLGAKRGDAAVHLDETMVAGRMRLSFGGGNDGVFVEDSELGQLVVRSRSGDDFVMAESTHVAGKVRIGLGRGDDAVVMTGSSEIEGSFRANGKRGSDTADLSASVSFARPPVLRHFAFDDLPAATIIDRLDNADTGIRTRSQSLWDFFAGLLG